jgi:hypothetical protein
MSDGAAVSCSSFAQCVDDPRGSRRSRLPLASPDTSGRIREVSAPRRNVECKASDPDPSGSLAVCRTLGAEDHGEIRQRDTYFTVPRGWLKLREEQPGRPHLIQFERASEPQQRESRYHIAEVENQHQQQIAV